MTRRCPTCGATVTFDPAVVADRCAFCESALVAGDADTEHADRVAPFLIDQRAASERLAHWLASRRWAPKHVRETRAPERLRGVLVPFWVHDAVARSRWTARLGIWWYRTVTYTVTVTRNGKTTTELRTKQVRETEWFHADGTHAASYADHLVSGSEGLSEDEANALEPFDLGGARPYAPELLAGRIAERPTIPRSRAIEVAADEVRRIEADAVAAFLPGDEARGIEVRSDIDVQPGSLVLLPVWIATYTWDDAVHRLLVNGQTGELVGSVPTSWMKITAAVVGGLAALALLVLVVLAVGAGLSS